MPTARRSPWTCRAIAPSATAPPPARTATRSPRIARGALVGDPARHSRFRIAQVAAYQRGPRQLELFERSQPLFGEIPPQLGGDRHRSVLGVLLQLRGAAAADHDRTD